MDAVIQTLEAAMVEATHFKAAMESEKSTKVFNIN